MAMKGSSAGWLEGVERAAGPLYLAIANALEAAIRAGELQGGDRLPPQRRVAEQLGIDFTTVSRAYRAAFERGLVEGAAGRGTFVRSRATEDDAGRVDLSMNLPPPPAGLSLGDLLQDTTSAILQRTDAAALMTYHPGAGTVGQKAAGAAWLTPCLGPVLPDRILVSPGAQNALCAVLSRLCKPGDTVVADALTYPGFTSLATRLGLRVLAAPSDEDGLIPDQLERICRDQRASAVYLVPTMQNPTAVTLSISRRREIAAMAERLGLWLIEDDPYARLMDQPLPALAAFAPDRTFFVATLAKCLTPGLRIAFLVCPSAWTEDIAQSLRATSLMPAPLMAAVAAAWIREGTADALLAAVRAEARARRALAAQTLPNAVGPADGVHVWLPLPASWGADRLRLAAHERGLSLVTAEAFAIAPDHPTGVRISLGGPSKRAVLTQALDSVAALVREGPTPHRLVV